MTIQRGWDRGKGFFIVKTAVFLVFLLTDKIYKTFIFIFIRHLVSSGGDMELQTLYVFETIL